MVRVFEHYKHGDKHVLQVELMAVYPAGHTPIQTPSLPLRYKLAPPKQAVQFPTAPQHNLHPTSQGTAVPEPFIYPSGTEARHDLFAGKYR